MIKLQRNRWNSPFKKKIGENGPDCSSGQASSQPTSPQREEEEEEGRRGGFLAVWSLTGVIPVKSIYMMGRMIRSGAAITIITTIYFIR